MVVLIFLCLLTHALTAGNVRNTVEILILTPCVFYTGCSILDIPIILYLCNVQLMGSVQTFPFFAIASLHVVSTLLKTQPILEK